MKAREKREKLREPARDTDHTITKLVKNNEGGWGGSPAGRAVAKHVQGLIPSAANQQKRQWEALFQFWSPQNQNGLLKVLQVAISIPSPSDIILDCFT